MPFCRKCGALTKENDIFCSRCGSRLQNQETNGREYESFKIDRLKDETQQRKQPIKTDNKKMTSTQMRRNLVNLLIIVVGTISLTAVIELFLSSTRLPLPLQLLRMEQPTNTIAIQPVEVIEIYEHPLPSIKQTQYRVYYVEGKRHVIDEEEIENFKFVFPQAEERKGISPIVHNRKVVEVPDNEVENYLSSNEGSRPFYEDFYKERNPIGWIVAEEARENRARWLKKNKGSDSLDYSGSLRYWGDVQRLTEENIYQYVYDKSKKEGIILNKLGSFQIGVVSLFVGIGEGLTEPYSNEISWEHRNITMAEIVQIARSAYKQQMLDNEDWLSR